MSRTQSNLNMTRIEKAQNRNEQILSILKNFDYVSAKNIAAIFDLNMKNVYRIMKQLEPYLSVFKDGGMTNIYYLNKNGREVVQSEKVCRRLTTAQHYIMRNELYIYLNQPESWENEIKISYVYNKNDPKSRKIIAVADAHYISSNNKHHVIEIDNIQKMYKNRIKIERYRRLIEKGVFNGIPEIVWVTTTEYRKKALLELCDGLDAKVYLRGELL